MKKSVLQLRLSSINDLVWWPCKPKLQNQQKLINLFVQLYFFYLFISVRTELLRHHFWSHWRYKFDNNLINESIITQFRWNTTKRSAFPEGISNIDFSLRYRCCTQHKVVTTSLALSPFHPHWMQSMTNGRCGFS